MTSHAHLFRVGIRASEYLGLLGKACNLLYYTLFSLVFMHALSVRNGAPYTSKMQPPATGMTEVVKVGCVSIN